MFDTTKDHKPEKTPNELRVEAALAQYAAENTSPITAARTESIEIAVELACSDAALQAIIGAVRVSRSNTIVLPAHRFERLSRGKGWARKGRGATAVWGERDDADPNGGYRVGPGRWTVGGNDGFSRKGETVWDVQHIDVGGQIWTVAS
jgi:hypothetical protein